MKIMETIEQRDARYGRFAHGAEIMQSIKQKMRSADGWRSLESDQKEALEMIVHKIGRILNGDPNYVDSWLDIAGYSSLIVDRLEKSDES